MKLAILGTDNDILALAAAARRAQHDIVWLGDVRPADAADLSSLAPAKPDNAANWELLLDRNVADAVLVGRGVAAPELLADRIKRLAAGGVPLLVVQPAFDSVLTCYEVDMIHREAGGIVQHYNPLMGHPAIAEIAEWMRSGHPDIGTIHQIACERGVATPSRPIVLAHLARDVELLAAFVGDIRRVTAIGPRPDDSSYAALQVQLNPTTDASLQWSVSFADSANANLECTFRGEHGRVTLRIDERAPNNSPPWHLETSVAGKRELVPLAACDSAAAAIERLARAVAATQSDHPARISTWDAATRAMEVVDAIELSLQKGRTIEVFQQQLTEQLAFRGTMAAFGCGILLLAFLTLVVVAILGAGEGAVKQRWGTWKFVLLAVLAFFLFLQTIPFLAGKSKSPRGEQPKPSPDNSNLPPGRTP